MYKLPPIQDSEQRISVESYSRLLQQVANGTLDRLRCPVCEQDSVSVCFAQDKPTQYRTWFLCASCDFRSRTHDAASPRATRDPGLRRDGSSPLPARA